MVHKDAVKPYHGYAIGEISVDSTFLHKTN